MLEQNRMREIGGDTSLYSYSLDICLGPPHSERKRVRSEEVDLFLPH
jgi:hypothetical protein